MSIYYLNCLYGNAIDMVLLSALRARRVRSGSVWAPCIPRDRHRFMLSFNPKNLKNLYSFYCIYLPGSTVCNALNEH